MPSTAASPASMVRRMARWGAIAGRVRSENASAVPAGVYHDRFWRPRPAVCSSATITAISGVPSRANSRARSLVEPIVA